MESSPAVTAFAGVLLGLHAFVDLVDLAASAAAARRDRWEVQAPSRFMAFMALTAYTYVFKHRRTTRFVPLSAEEEKLVGVKTGVVFTWAFFEMIAWFWVSAPHSLFQFQEVSPFSHQLREKNTDLC